MKQLQQLILIMLLLAAMQTGRAQVVGTPYVGEYAPCTSMGNDFWMTFGNNRGNSANNGYLALNIAAQVRTTVTIRFTANSHSYTYIIPAGTSRKIDLRQMVSDGSAAAVTDERVNAYIANTFLATNGLAGGTSNQTMHITSSNPVSVYAFNTQNVTTDATVVYPVVTWGTDYYQVSYQALNNATFPANMNSGQIIIANQDNTIITLYGDDGTTVSSTLTLNAGQVYANNESSRDITGRHITSSKPVAYFASAQLAWIPYNVASGDVFDEQMTPTSLWDKQYFVPNVPQFSNPSSAATNNRIRVMASKNNTVVNYAGASLPPATSLVTVTIGTNKQIASGGTLNAGQWVELAINSTTNTGGAYITANNPVGVAGHLIGGDSTSTTATSSIGINGDPDNAMIPGLNQMGQVVIISPFIPPGDISLSSATTKLNDSNAIHGAIIVTKTANKSLVVMTRGSDPTNLITGTSWIDDPNNSGTSSYYYKFDNTADIGASFSITSPGGVFVMAYGLGNYESYYYNAGSAACSLL